MKKLIILALLCFAGWYGWKHYPEVFQRLPAHEAVIENNSGVGMERIRLKVDGQTFVKEMLPDGQKAVFAFRVSHDSSFELVWSFTGRQGEPTWSGGMVPVGPMAQRHIFTIDEEGAVYYHPQNK